VLAEVATREPHGPLPGRRRQTQDLVDMARRTNDVRGRQVRLVPTWSGLIDPSMAGDVLLCQPGEGARITPTTFDEWLVAGAAP
jgi:hypothetical protein